MSISYFRKAGLALLALLLAASLLSVAVQAAPAQDITVRVNGQVVALDVKPLVEDGRTLVPLRGVFEKLGAQVDWLSATGEAVVTGDGHVVRVKPGSKNATVDGRIITMDVEAKTVSGRTLVPLRFLSESIGAKVIWVDGTRTVEILDVNKLTPEQQQLLAAFDNLKDARKADRKMVVNTKSAAAGDQSFNISMEITSKVAINNNDRHIWVNMTLPDSDLLDIPAELMTMEVIKKSDQVYARMGNEPWQAVDQSELGLPLTVSGTQDEAFLQFYNSPFTVENNVKMDGQDTTAYSVIIDQKTFTDMMNGLNLPNGGGGKDQELFWIFKGMAVGNGSEKIYLDSKNRIIHDSATINVSFQPSAVDQPEGMDLTGFTITGDIETSYDYSGTPEPIVAPTGVFPKA